MFTMSLISGLISILTPTVFPLLLIYFFIFAKFSRSSKGHWLNIALLIILYLFTNYFLSSQVVSMEMASFSILSYLPLLITLEILTIIFAIWLTGFLILMIEKRGINITNQIFRYLGICVISFKLVFSSFSCMGPIIGAMLVGGDSASFQTGLIGFSIGVIIPFVVILGFAQIIYKRNREKKWIKIPQVVIGLILIVSSIFKLYQYFQI
jgi:hypothetical protein